MKKKEKTILMVGAAAAAIYLLSSFSASKNGTPENPVLKILGIDPVTNRIHFEINGRVMYTSIAHTASFPEARNKEYALRTPQPVNGIKQFLWLRNGQPLLELARVDVSAYYTPPVFVQPTGPINSTPNDL